MTTRYIAIDWGSTNLRAWLFQEETCLGSRQSEAGVTRLAGRAPRAVLAEITHDWQEGHTPVFMAGMVGSNAGWMVAPYLPCPVKLNDISRHLTTVGDKIWIIPGLSVNREDNHNVMRGEETQLLGAHHLSPSRLYIMPGTHSKWVQVDEGQVVDFRTAMTGELFHLLLDQSLIGVGIETQYSSPSAFSAGVAQAQAQPDLLPQLFEVRASHLLGAVDRAEVSEYLSGLLIGNEVGTLLRRFQPAPQEPITIVANPGLANRYAHALEARGHQAHILEGDSAFQAGIRSIAHAMGN